MRGRPLKGMGAREGEGMFSTMILGSTRDKISQWEVSHFFTIKSLQPHANEAKF